MLLTGDEKLALKARSNDVNSYVVDWLLTLEPTEIVKLLGQHHTLQPSKVIRPE